MHDQRTLAADTAGAKWRYTSCRSAGGTIVDRDGGSWGQREPITRTGPCTGAPCATDTVTEAREAAELRTSPDPERKPRRPARGDSIATHTSPSRFIANCISPDPEP